MLKTPVSMLLAVSLIVLMQPGCKRDAAPPRPEGPDHAEEVARKDSAARSRDLRAMSEFLSETAGNTAPPGPARLGDARNSPLPPGHPPIGDEAESTSAAGLPPGHPPITIPLPSEGADASPAPSESPALVFDAPKDWKQTKVERAFRQAQYLIPRAGSDTEDGEMILYYFGKNEGGSVQMNLDRWKGQFTTAQGEPIAEGAYLIEKFVAGGMKVTMLDVAGHFHDAMFSPHPAKPSERAYRMYAAVVETDDGPFFFKAIGPVNTMAEHRDAFVTMLRSVRR